MLNIGVLACVKPADILSKATRITRVLRSTVVRSLNNLPTQPVDIPYLSTKSSHLLFPICPHVKRSDRL